jgi:hypothetical protein
VRSYLLDELSPVDMASLQARLDQGRDKAVTASGLAGLYWALLPEGLLTPLQAGHAGCRPHRFAVELGADYLKVELLIRPVEGLRCPCCGLADPAQRAYILDWADRLAAELKLRT